MLNPFGSEKIPGSYMNLQKRMLQHVQAMKVEDQIFSILQNAYEQALNQENVVLSRPERMRLLSQIMKTVLENMLKRLNDGSPSA